MRYYRRRWNDLRTDQYTSWGPSWWWFETTDDGTVTRQVEVYDDGPTLGYSTDHAEDTYGELTTEPLDPREWQPYLAPPEGFENVWRSVPASPTGRGGSDHAGPGHPVVPGERVIPGEHVWTLRRDGDLVAELAVISGDRPWVTSWVSAKPGMDDLRPLFERELDLLDEPDTDPAAWESAQQQLQDTLELHRPDGRAVREFVLHVDGNHAWWRWDDGESTA